MRYLRQRFPTVKISVEIEKPGREGLSELAIKADVVFYSKSWAKVKGVGPFFLVFYAEAFFDLGKWPFNARKLLESAGCLDLECVCFVLSALLKLKPH